MVDTKRRSCSMVVSYRYVSIPEKITLPRSDSTGYLDILLDGFPSHDKAILMASKDVIFPKEFREIPKDYFTVLANLCTPKELAGFIVLNVPAIKDEMEKDGRIKSIILNEADSAEFSDSNNRYDSLHGLFGISAEVASCLVFAMTTDEIRRLVISGLMINAGIPEHVPGVLLSSFASN